MSIITASEVREQLKNEAPWIKKGREQIWLIDPTNEKLCLSDLKLVIKACSVEHFQFIPDVWDCDNFMLQLLSRSRQLQYDLLKAYPKQEKQYPWMMAMIICNHNAYRGIHGMNMAITSDAGIQYIEPQTNEISSVLNGELLFVFG